MLHDYRGSPLHWGIRVRRVLLPLALCFFGCAHVTESQLASMTVNIKPGMSGADVDSIMGEPWSRRAEICGEEVGPGWRCTQWEYASHGRHLVLYFSDARDGLALEFWRWNY